MHNMKLITIAITLLLSACGNTPTPQAASKPETSNVKRVDRRPKLRNDCELVASGQRIKLETETVTADVYICEISLEYSGFKQTLKRVEFQYNDAVTVDASIGTWPSDGRIPDFYNPNINCELQECFKTVME